MSAYPPYFETSEGVEMPQVVPSTSSSPMSGRYTTPFPTYRMNKAVNDVDTEQRTTSAVTNSNRNHQQHQKKNHPFDGNTYHQHRTNADGTVDTPTAITASSLVHGSFHYFTNQNDDDDEYDELESHRATTNHIRPAGEGRLSKLVTPSPSSSSSIVVVQEITNNSHEPSHTMGNDDSNVFQSYNTINPHNKKKTTQYLNHHSKQYPNEFYENMGFTERHFHHSDDGLVSPPGSKKRSFVDDGSGIAANIANSNCKGIGGGFRQLFTDSYNAVIDVIGTSTTALLPQQQQQQQQKQQKGRRGKLHHYQQRGSIPMTTEDDINHVVSNSERIKMINKTMSHHKNNPSTITDGISYNRKKINDASHGTLLGIQPMQELLPIQASFSTTFEEYDDKTKPEKPPPPLKSMYNVPYLNNEIGKFSSIVDNKNGNVNDNNNVITNMKHYTDEINFNMPIYDEMISYANNNYDQTESMQVLDSDSERVTSGSKTTKASNNNNKNLHHNQMIKTSFQNVYNPFDDHSQEVGPSSSFMVPDHQKKHDRDREVPSSSMVLHNTLPSIDHKRSKVVDGLDVVNRDWNGVYFGTIRGNSFRGGSFQRGGMSTISELELDDVTSMAARTTTKAGVCCPRLRHGTTCSKIFTGCRNTMKWLVEKTISQTSKILRLPPVALSKATKKKLIALALFIGSIYFVVGCMSLNDNVGFLRDSILDGLYDFSPKSHTLTTTSSRGLLVLHEFAFLLATSLMYFVATVFWVPASISAIATGWLVAKTFLVSPPSAIGRDELTYYGLGSSQYDDATLVASSINMFGDDEYDPFSSTSMTSDDMVLSASIPVIVSVAGIVILIGACLSAMVSFLLGRYLLQDTWKEHVRRAIQSAQRPVFYSISILPGGEVEVNSSNPSGRRASVNRQYQRLLEHDEEVSDDVMHRVGYLVALDRCCCSSLSGTLSYEGYAFLVILRLNPFIPFGIVNYWAGATSVSIFNYAVSLMAMVPGIFLYALWGVAIVVSATDAIPNDGNHNNINTLELLQTTKSSIVTVVIGIQVVLGVFAVFVAIWYVQMVRNELLIGSLIERPVMNRQRDHDTNYDNRPVFNGDSGIRRQKCIRHGRVSNSGQNRSNSGMHYNRRNDSIARFHRTPSTHVTNKATSNRSRQHQIDDGAGGLDNETSEEFVMFDDSSLFPLHGQTEVSIFRE